MHDKVGRDRQRILEAKTRGARLRTYAALSGPGWLQSAITLGGGSLAGSLYLGVLTGFSLLWLQPLAMLMGVVMLGAIAYVTLSTGERPFRAINEHVNPVLGWGWAIATLLANIVWSLPQFALGTAAVQQNLVPALDGTGGKVVICATILLVAVAVIWFYDSGGRGVRIFERILELMVGVVVVSFIGVVIVMSIGGALDWQAIAAGYVPDLSLLWQPASTFDAYLDAVAPEYRVFWSDKIVDDQRDVMVTAAATAVGINMTFLLPYSMLARGWDVTFRGLALFDLVTGLLLPFILATSCIVVASSTQFHAKPDAPLLAGESSAPAAAVAQYDGLLSERAAAAGGEVDPRHLPAADKRMASMLVRRDAFDLADSLTPLTGRGVAQYVFGVGVFGMAVSTVIILMLISGFVVCEMLGIEPRGRARRWGCMVAGIGVIGPFVWTGDAKFWLAVPTSVFGMMLLPIAYLTFFCLMNSRGLMRDTMPRGAKRAATNALMVLAVGLATFGASWSIWRAAGWIGVAVALGFLALALAVHVGRRSARRELS